MRVHRARLALQKPFECGLETPVSQAHYDAQMCQDLIEAKQVAIDRGATFKVPQQDVLTNRYQAVFDSLDLRQDLCTSPPHSPLPIDIAARITTAIKLSKDS